MESKKKGKVLEENYEWLRRIGVNKNCLITSPKYYKDRVTGNQREIDIFIENLDNNGEVIETIMVECRNRGSVQDVTWVEQVVTKKNDLGIDKAIMVTTSSFTEPARIKAKHYGIEVERATPQTNIIIDEINESSMGYVEFIYMECLSVKVYTNKGIFTQRDFDNLPNIKNYLKNQITGFCESEGMVKDIHDRLNSIEKFFSSSKNNITTIYYFKPAEVIFKDIIGMNNYSNNFDEIGTVNKIEFELSISPKTYPIKLSRMITIFDDDLPKKQSNKRHKSLFENKDLEWIFHLENNVMNNEITIKNPKKYWKFYSIRMTVHAIWDEEKLDNEKSGFTINNNLFDIKGEINFENLWK